MLERTRRPIIAADIARFGEDETVIIRREGGWIRVYRAHHKADTMVTAGQIAKAMRDIDAEARKNDWVKAIIDVPGVGGGVVDRLVELGLPVTPYNGAEAPFDRERFVNARAEGYWNLREIFENEEIDIDELDDELDDKLAAQLGSIKWTVDSRGRIKIESKEDMRKRGMPSPDRADIVAQAFSRRGSAAPITSRVTPAKASPET
jgi:phage terminase large subunit